MHIANTIIVYFENKSYDFQYRKCVATVSYSPCHFVSIVYYIVLYDIQINIACSCIKLFEYLYASFHYVFWYLNS